MGTRITKQKRTVCGWPVRDAPTLAEELLDEAPQLWVWLSEGRITAEQAREELERRRST